MSRFKLSETFIEEYKAKRVDWGPLGEFIYLRTYSRFMESENRNERWWETVRRVAEGTFNTQKDHCAKLRLPWNNAKAQTSAKIMYEKIFNFKFTPSGRGLFLMGTDFAEKRGAAALSSCAFITTEDIETRGSFAFCWTMDALMLGLGVGFDTKGAGKITIKEPKEGNGLTFQIPDSREGWVEGLSLVLDACFYGRKIPTFDFSLIRVQGLPIKGFGGVSSGHEVLKELYKDVEKLLSKRIEEHLSSTDIVDIMNLIARTVIAGNVRRCLATTSAVFTKKGLIQIKDINIGDEVLTSNGYKKVTNKFEQGKHKLLKITTPETEIKATPNHRLAVFNKTNSYTWKKVEELTEKDRLVSIIHNGGKETITPEKAWLYGLYVGDGSGYIRKNHGGGTVSFAMSNERLEDLLGEKTKKIILEEFNYEPKLSSNKKNSYSHIRIYNKKITLDFMRYKEVNSCPKILPEIWDGTPEIRGAFLAGLADADGDMRNVLVYSKYPEFCKEVQKLALTLGIATLLHYGKERIINGRDKIYDGANYVSIRGIQSQKNTKKYIEPFATRWKCILRDKKKNGLNLSYILIQEQAKEDEKLKQMIKNSIIAPNKWVKNSFSNANYDTLIENDLANPDWIPLEILSIEECEEDLTFDIEVEDNHEFICEGILSHNSAEIAFGSPEDKEYVTMKDYNLHPKELKGWRWACITGETIINTIEGSYSIEELVEKENLYIVLDSKTYKVNGVKYTGDKEVFEIKTISGQSIKASANHQFMTPNGWKKVDKLSVGNKLTISDNKKIKVITSNNKFKEGYLVGHLIGDGTFCSTTTTGSDIARLQLYEGDEGLNSMKNYIESIFSKINKKYRSDFTGKFKEVKQETGNWWYLSLKSFTKMAAKYGVKKGSKILTEEIEKESNSFVSGIISALFDTDGWFIKDRNSYAIEQSDKETIYRLQRLLLRMGVKTNINFLPKRTHKINNRSVNRKCSYRLVICGTEETKKFLEITALKHSKKIDVFDSNKNSKPQLKKCYEIESITSCGIEKVYDMNVEDIHAFSANGFYVHNSNNAVTAKVGKTDYSKISKSIIVNGEPGIVWQENAKKFGRLKDGETWTDKNIGFTNPCGEIFLESCELCNLIETFPSRHDSYEEYKETLKYAYLYGKTITLLSTHWPETNQVVMKNRRIGLSQTGIIDAFVKHGRREMLNWCDNGYKYLRELDEIYSNWFCIPKSIKISTTKPSGCRPWDAIVVTNEGIFLMNELFENHKEDEKWSNINLLFAEQNDKNSKITRTYYNGKAKTAIIKLSYGFEIESTLNHKWFVKTLYERGKSIRYKNINDWVETKDLKKNHILDFKIGTYKSTIDYKLEKVNTLSFKMRADYKKIKQPDFLDNDLAWLLGYLWGDGAQSPSKYRIRFIDANKYNLEKIKRIVKEKFDLKSNIFRSSEHKKAFTLDISSKILWHWFIKNDFYKYFNDKIDIIPQKIRKSSYKNIIAFIAGLIDADGCVSYKNNKYNEIILSTASDLFSKNVQDIGAAVGLIFGRSLNTKGKNFQKRKHIWLMPLTQFSDKNSFFILKQNSNKMQKENMKYPETPFSTEIKLAFRKNFGLIKEITVSDKLKETGDIEVENNHWYYSSIFKSHNSVSLLPGVSPGIHYPHSEYYIRRVRIASDSNLIEPLRKAGYHIEQEKNGSEETRKKTLVVSFPIHEENFVKKKEDVSIWEQVKNVIDYQTYWSDNSVSCTVTFNKKEADDIPRVLEAFEDQLKAISFLPLLDHQYEQAPYETILQHQYEEMTKNLKLIDFSKATTIPIGEKFCDSDTCEI